MKTCTAVCLGIILAVPAHGGSSSAYVGAKICGACHAAEFAAQSSSAHAAALFRLPDHLLSASFLNGVKLFRQPKYQYEIVRASSGFRVNINDGTNLIDLPLEWAFGAGRQAVTFVTRVDKHWYVEHYASYYSALHRYGATPGHEAVHPASLAEAAGVLYQITDPQTGIAGCFECHSTGPVSFGRNGEAQITELGVHCEACHGPGAAHVRNPSRHSLRNPARSSATGLNHFCGRCHRPPAASGMSIDWTYAWNVRHQPVYLSQSRCFVRSRGALSCLTCHAPHEPAGKKPAAYYNAKCVGCHSASVRPPSAPCATQAPPNCINCHMPLVSPQPALRFANHWIGVYRTGAMLRPVQ